MITYTDESIFDSSADALVCPVNKVGVMGKGLALEFKQCFPLTARMYFEWCRRVDLKPEILVARSETEKRIIVFLPTKTDWRKPADLDLIEDGLRCFVKGIQQTQTLEQEGLVIRSASFPKLGCGLGQLDWDTQVRPLMERYLKDLPIPITIHLFP